MERSNLPLCTNLFLLSRCYAYHCLILSDLSFLGPKNIKDGTGWHLNFRALSVFVAAGGLARLWPAKKHGCVSDITSQIPTSVGKIVIFSGSSVFRKIFTPTWRNSTGLGTSLIRAGAHDPTYHPLKNWAGALGFSSIADRQFLPGGLFKQNENSWGPVGVVYSNIIYKVVPPSYKLIYDPINCRYIYHKSYLLKL